MATVSKKDRKAQILRFMTAWEKEQPYPPTLDQIAAGMEPPYKSRGSLSLMVNELISEGKLARSGPLRLLHLVKKPKALPDDTLNKPRGILERILG